VEIDGRQYWPFGQDALKRHREWLRKWLMATWKHLAVVGLCFALLVPLINKKPAPAVAAQEAGKPAPLCQNCKLD